jgi:hypothetical protein
MAHCGVGAKSNLRAAVSRLRFEHPALHLDDIVDGNPAAGAVRRAASDAGPALGPCRRKARELRGI